MNDAEILAEFHAAEAILKGHFILSSGLHSDTYLQCARVLMNPKRAEKLCAALANKIRMSLGSPMRGGTSGPDIEGIRGEQDARQTAKNDAYDARARQAPIDLVVAPAMGGVVLGYEMGRQLGVETIFCEREEGEFRLRRGFAITPGQRVLMVEDVVTTGKSSMEAVKCVEKAGGLVVAEASLIDRSNGTHALPFPLISLLTLNVKTFESSAVPSELKDIPAIKPGSRFLKK
jgi:orotate phosphoribosyltransferase